MSFPRSAFLLLVLYLTAGTAMCAAADQAREPAPAAMSNERLGRIIHRLDAQAGGQSGNWTLTVEGLQVRVITDERADRMRILVPVAEVEALDEAVLYRMLQANFDTALDARYAIARKVVWATYIHPLGPLQDKEFLSGLGQVVNLALGFGTSYSSGALLFQGGDSAAIQRRELIDRLIEEGLAI